MQIHPIDIRVNQKKLTQNVNQICEWKISINVAHEFMDAIMRVPNFHELSTSTDTTIIINRSL